MIHSYLNHLSSSVLPDHEHRAPLLTSQNLWFERKYGSLHLLLHTLPEFCIKPLDFLFTQKWWFLICRCSTLPQHMDLVLLWRFELAEASTLTEDTHLVGPWPDWKWSRRSFCLPLSLSRGGDGKEEGFNFLLFDEREPPNLRSTFHPPPPHNSFITFQRRQ